MMENGERLTIAIIRNLSEWFRVKTELIDSEERFRSFVEQSMEGILLVDDLGAVREWNQAMETITGMKKSTVIGSPVWAVLDQVDIVQSEKMRLIGDNYRARVKQAVETKESLFFNRVLETVGHRSRSAGHSVLRIFG